MLALPYFFRENTVLLFLVYFLLFLNFSDTLADPGSKFRSEAKSRSPESRDFTIRSNETSVSANEKQLIAWLNATDKATRLQAVSQLSLTKNQSNEVGAALAKQLTVEQERTVVLAILSFLQKRLPESDQVVASLTKLLDSKDYIIRSSTCDTLGAYGSYAHLAAPELIKAANDSENLVRCSAIDALRLVEPSVEHLQLLMNSPTPEHRTLASAWLNVYLPHPELALEMLKKHPGLIEKLGDRFFGEREVMQILAQKDKSYDVLKSYLHSHPDLPAAAMVQIGNKSYIPIIKERLKEADSYQRSWLEACLLALGENPTRTITASYSQPTKDSMQDLRRSRARIKVNGKTVRSSIGHGFTRTLFTGSFLTTDGKPVKEPHIHLVTVDGNEVETPHELSYDPQTGRFYFFAFLRANYSIGPSPYSVEELRVVIHASGMEPLELTFFDEMPHLIATLAEATPTK